MNADAVGARSVCHLATINPSITVLLFREHLLRKRKKEGREGRGAKRRCRA